MSIEKKELKCCVCRAYLFEEDDTVFCPVCGAPHHRECYNTLGHCGVEEFHGTEKQYDLLKEKEEAMREEELKNPRSKFKEAENPTANRNFKEASVCKNCGAEYPSIINRCPKCGAPNTSQNTPPYPFVPFDLLGGVPSDMDLGKGVKASEAGRFVAANSHRYIPKFAAFSSGQKASWNWVAFLFPSVWFLSRKMYTIGAVLTVLLLVFNLLDFPLISALNFLNLAPSLSPYQLTEVLSENFQSIGIAPFVLAGISSIGTILTSILSAVFADRVYYKHTINTVSSLKKDTDIDFDFSCRKKGSISLIAMLIGLFIIEYLPNILFSFL